MAKQRSKTNTKQANKFLIIGLGILLGLIALLITLQFWYNTYVYRKIYEYDNAQTKELFINSLLGTTERSPSVDIATAEVYIPDAKIKFNQYPDFLTGGMVFSHSIASNNQEEYVQIASKNAINSSIGQMRNSTDFDTTLAQLPIAQACTRQAVIAFEPIKYQWETDDYTLSSSGSLNDGRAYKLYISNKCPYQSSEISEYLSSIQSY